MTNISKVSKFKTAEALTVSYYAELMLAENLLEVCIEKAKAANAETKKWKAKKPVAAEAGAKKSKKAKTKVAVEEEEVDSDKRALQVKLRALFILRGMIQEYIPDFTPYAGNDKRENIILHASKETLDPLSATKESI